MSVSTVRFADVSAKSHAHYSYTVICVTFSKDNAQLIILAPRILAYNVCMRVAVYVCVSQLNFLFLQAQKASSETAIDPDDILMKSPRQT